jgi:Tfp pilus assembly protein PilF
MSPLSPNEAAAMFDQAREREAAGDLDAVADIYGRLVEADAADANLRAALGNMEQRRGAPGAAERHYRAALELDPGLMAAWSNLGALQRAGGRLDDALASFKRAVALDPGSTAARINLALALSEAGDIDQALEHFAQAIECDASIPEAHFNQGNARCAVNDFAGAAQSYARALALRPDFADARWNMAHPLLMQGRFAEGWAAFEARWEIDQLKESARRYAQPLWTGQALEGRTLYLWGEQGFGDVLQFSRYATPAARCGARVVLGVQPELHELAATIDGVAEVVRIDAAPAQFDFHCPMMSLPRAFGTTAETIPAPVPYLRVDEARARAFAARLSPTRRLRVGLVWSSGIRRHSRTLYRVGIDKSLPSRLMGSLRHPGVEFFSLQTGDVERDGSLPMTDFSAELRSFADTAALVSHLDLVISVDTAAAHLAGALGKPVWLLINTHACWRWGSGGERSAWYPTMRIFRQQHAGDWRAPLADVRSALVALVRSAGAAGAASWLGRLTGRGRG